MSGLDNWDDMLWHEIPFVALDTETTGLGPDDRIVQIAFSSFYDSGLRTKSWLVYPGRSIPEAASNVHGITDSMVRGAPMFRDILDEVLEELNRAPWVAHNMPFDAKMLAKEIPRERWPRGIPTLCTLSYARTRHPDTKYRRRHKLADLANTFAQDYKTASLHDAGYDAEILAHVTQRMMRDLSVGKHMTKFSEDWLK
jgi:DNA polymerase-3 subunit epsilon